MRLPTSPAELIYQSLQLFLRIILDITLIVVLFESIISKKIWL